MHSVRISAVAAAVLLLMAAAPVEEARPAPSTGVTTPTDPDDADDAGGIGTLFYQLQILQDEVRRLQGIVEEQNYRIERLVREQRERYIELDQRLLALRPDAAQPPGEGGPDGPDPASTVPGAASVQGEAYNRAYAVMAEARRLLPSERAIQYQRALTMFDAVIQEHPHGEFTPNAYYWIGELYLAMDMLEEARQAFAQVTNLYAEHAKMPDSLYKLGVTYHRLGDNARALGYLDRVTDEYPDSAQAGLARSYAAELR